MTSVCRFRFINSVAVKEKKKTPKNKQINASLKGCLYSPSSVSRSHVNICSTGPTQDMQKSELRTNTLSAAPLCTHTIKLGRCNFGFKALQQKDSISACLCRGFLGWWWCGWCFFFNYYFLSHRSSPSEHLQRSSAVQRGPDKWCAGFYQTASKNRQVEANGTRSRQLQRQR